MIHIVFWLAVGFGIGLLVQKWRAKKDIEPLRRQLSILQKERGIWHRDARAEQEKQQRKQAWYRQNDLADYQNQCRFVRQCGLFAKAPVNSEAVKILYELEKWIKKWQPEWRLGFEVSMGAFVGTQSSDDKPLSENAFRSYNSKRIDFLLIDRYGKPRLAVEYNGSGHNLSGDAEERMAVKKIVLDKIGVPLLEVSEGMPVMDIHRTLQNIVDAA